MAKARGTAIFSTALLLLHFMMITAAYTPTTYIVKDDFGWDDLSITAESWTFGKKFYAGDILVFHYNSSGCNVVAVNQTGHDTCSFNEGAIEYRSGDDHIPLVFGANYFISTKFPGQCVAGCKMAINATAPPPN